MPPSLPPSLPSALPTLSPPPRAHTHNTQTDMQSSGHPPFPSPTPHLPLTLPSPSSSSSSSPSSSPLPPHSVPPPPRQAAAAPHARPSHLPRPHSSLFRSPATPSRGRPPSSSGSSCCRASPAPCSWAPASASPWPTSAASSPPPPHLLLLLLLLHVPPPPSPPCAPSPSPQWTGTECRGGPRLVLLLGQNSTVRSLRTTNSAGLTSPTPSLALCPHLTAVRLSLFEHTVFQPEFDAAAFLSPRPAPPLPAHPPPGLP